MNGSGHSVSVTRSGSLIGVGYIKDGEISGSLEKAVISHFSEFSMNDSSGWPLAPVSAVCTESGTLYMFTKSCGIMRKLVYCDVEINDGTPFFIDIGNHDPVSLFGGCSHAAVICTDGEVIFINRDSVTDSPSSRIDAVSLPGGEKATMVACLSKSVFALSWSGRVFASAVESIFQRFQNCQAKKSSGCLACAVTAWQSAVKAGSLGADQTVMANSALSEGEVKFPRSLRFRHFLATKSGQPTPDVIIHFSRRVKAKSSPVDTTVMANSSSGWPKRRRRLFANRDDDHRRCHFLCCR